MTKAQLLRFWGRLRARLLPLGDLSGWVLILVAAVPLVLLDPAMLITLAQWTAYGLALAGIAVIINRMLLPQIKLNDWLSFARSGNTAAGIVVAAVLGLLAAVFLGLVLWAKT